LGFPGRSTLGGGWVTEDEEFLLVLVLVVEVCEGVDAIGGADFVRRPTELADGALALFSVGGEAWPLPVRVGVPPRRPPRPPRPRSLLLAPPRPLFSLRTVEPRSSVCLQSSRVEVGPAGGGMESEAMMDR
jgi:hypothetical protein